MTGALNVTIGGLILASALMTIGCADAIARADHFEVGDFRIDRAVKTARQACQERQPKTALPSTTDYERCVLAELRSAEVTAAKR